jgi:hypothetical protein
MAFLLAWDTGRVLELFPLIYVLSPQLVHLCQSSLPLPSPLPIVALATLRFLYSFLLAHQPHSRFWFPSLALSLLGAASP